MSQEHCWLANLTAVGFKPQGQVTQLLRLKGAGQSWRKRVANDRRHGEWEFCRCCLQNRSCGQQTVTCNDQEILSRVRNLSPLGWETPPLAKPGISLLPASMVADKLFLHVGIGKGRRAARRIPRLCITSSRESDARLCSAPSQKHFATATHTSRRKRAGSCFP